MLTIHPSKATETEKACVLATVGNVHFRKVMTNSQFITPVTLLDPAQVTTTAVRCRHTIAGEFTGMCLKCRGYTRDSRSISYHVGPFLVSRVLGLRQYIHSGSRGDSRTSFDERRTRTRLRLNGMRLNKRKGTVRVGIALVEVSIYQPWTRSLAT
jgi:hypothetical protein